MMRLTLYALAVAGITCTLNAGEPIAGYRNHPLTIDKAIQLALKQNPSILQQIQQLKVQKGLVFQAQAKLLPQLTAATNYSQTDSALAPSISSSSPNFDLLAVPSGEPLTVVNGKTNAISVPVGGLSGGSTGTSNQTWQVTLTAS